ncbi:metal ABC transporter permease [Actinopolymorpha alba]|uniref:metal ABC transporter permease n=1 Tax=Actinopolymorpha alba TaxID=533267 RepID=UPI000368F12D|nr:metal ABC transporter permease [Actinopolymorpha alba]
MEILQYDFMQRALLAALLIGLAAPAVGVYLVQRRLALIGDGMGHVALTGVGIGLVTGTAPIWTALACAVAGAVAIELMRAKGRTSSDVALAVLFYGGIAGGVVLMAKSSGSTPANLNAYLFGSITSTTPTDLVVFGVLAVVVLLTMFGLSRLFFTVGADEEYANAAGLPVLPLNLALAIMVAVTVVVSMRVVGLLLVSALMIVPVAAAQRLSRSFTGTAVVAMAVGVVVSVGGVLTSYYADTPSGGTIVLAAIAVFVVAVVGTALRAALRQPHHEAEDHLHAHGPTCGHPAIRHEDHVDYVHDGHRHAPHGAHYDEHGG